MAIYKLYSKQRPVSKAQAPDYRYDILPDSLKTQILTIFDRAIGAGSLLGDNAATVVYNEVDKILRHEYAIPALFQYDNSNQLSLLLTGDSVRRFFRAAQVDQCLDVIQVFLSVAKEVLEKGKVTAKYPEMSLEDGIAEINERFREHRVGFQYVEGQIIRIDSEFAHQQITLPALKLLKQNYLKGANEEFLSALEHHRHGRHKECLNDCLKAFESTMKSICHKRGWAYNQNDTAKKLINICEKNKLFPVFMAGHITGLRLTLEAGVPTARNKTSGHGQGATQITVSEQFVTYVLNLTASNICFLAASEQALK